LFTPTAFARVTAQLLKQRQQPLSPSHSSQSQPTNSVPAAHIYYITTDSLPTAFHTQHFPSKHRHNTLPRRFPEPSFLHTNATGPTPRGDPLTDQVRTPPTGQMCEETMQRKRCGILWRIRNTAVLGRHHALAPGSFNQCPHTKQPFCQKGLQQRLVT
jgi:hypothetical protein